MPLHKIFAPPSLYSKQDKKDFAAAITSFYSVSVSLNPLLITFPFLFQSTNTTPFSSFNQSFLPEFYVVVLFPRVEEEDFFIGSQTHSDRAREAKPFVRWQVEHLAKQSVGAQERAGLMTKLEQIGKPFLADRNFDWEVSSHFQVLDVA